MIFTLIGETKMIDKADIPPNSFELKPGSKIWHHDLKRDVEIVSVYVNTEHFKFPRTHLGYRFMPEDDSDFIYAVEPIERFAW